MLIKGKIVSGRGMGRKLGIPTANVKLDKNYKILETGVFAGLITIKNKKQKAAIFIGSRLTFNLIEPTIEATIIDFDDDLYGQRVELEIGEKIREISKFKSVDGLKRRVLLDIKKVQSLSQDLKPKFKTLKSTKV